MANYLNKLENEADEYIKEINIYHEQEVNKQVEIIRNKYNVALS